MPAINIAELRQITELMLNHIEEVYGQTVELPVDYYWDIPDDKLYDINAEPQELNVGQLSEDWGFLMKMGEDSADPLTYGSVWIANILRAIGNTHIS